MAASYVLGVSTRRVEKLVATLGITALSKSQVSEMAKSLDVLVEQFRTRPLDAGATSAASANSPRSSLRSFTPRSHSRPKTSTPRGN